MNIKTFSTMVVCHNYCSPSLNATLKNLRRMHSIAEKNDHKIKPGDWLMKVDSLDLENYLIHSWHDYPIYSMNYAIGGC